MNADKKALITISVIVLAILMIACSISSLIPGNTSSSTESMPGLAGTWQDPETTDTFIIVWKDNEYVVTSITWEGHSYSITSQSWTGSSLTWSYYDTDLSTTTTYETTSLSGDNLYVNWHYADGSGGTETLSRVR